MDEKDQENAPFPVTFIDVDGEKVDGEPAVKIIMFKQPSEGQLAIIARGVRKARRGGGNNTVEAVGLILDVIDKLVVDRDDRNWLEDGLVNDEVSLDDFIRVLDGINASDDKADVPHPVTPSRARSGRR